MRFGRFSIMLLEHVTIRFERTNGSSFVRLARASQPKTKRSEALAPTREQAAGCTAARSSTRKFVVRVRLEGFRMDSIAQTRVVTSMPVKTTVELAARAIRPKTYISNDEGPRLQKRRAAGFK